MANNIVSNENHRSFIKSLNTNIFFHPVTEQVIFNHLISLDPSKATGYDNIPARLLIDGASVITKPLCHIINLSLQSGIFPEALKIAKVTPVFKKGSPYDTNNYRPISILPTLSKILEKVVYKQLESFLEKHALIFKHQYGFRKNYSTKLALINLLNDILHMIDDGNIVLGIYLDLTKAFDTIDHDILCDKLSLYGVRGVPLNWFESYLSNRKQFVSVGNHNSSLTTISYGVPQGSILGPLLFLLYINDLPESSTYFTSRLFADDSNFFHAFPNNNANISEANTAFNHIVQWCSANKLTISKKKTNYVLLSTHQRNFKTHGKIYINSHDIDYVKHVTHLGVEIDSHLTWKYHIKNVCDRISPKIGLLSKLRYFVPKHILLLLYKSFILPHITYCLEVWGSTYPSALIPIHNLIKKLVRIITFKSFLAPSAPLFKELGIMNIYELFKYQTAVFIHDLITGILPFKFSDYFTYPSHQYSTRSVSKSTVLIPKRKLTIGQFSFSYQGAQIWNSLPLEIKKITSRNHFKKTLKSHILNQL